jgi:hypothetical protein
MHSEFERSVTVCARDEEGSEADVFHVEILRSVFGSMASRDARRRFGLVAV